MTAKYRIPVVTLVLVVANLCGTIALLFDPSLMDQDGFVASAPSATSVLISPFLHVNLLHLLGNLIFLAAVGGSLEVATGPLRFSVVYVLSALAGEAMQWLVFHNSLTANPLVGASAAIAGCAGYYAIRYSQLRIPVAPRVSLPIIGVVGIWALLQLMGAFVHLGNGHTEVGYWSHIGGLGMGVLLCLIFRAPDLGQAKLDDAVLDEARRQGPEVMLNAAKEVLKKRPNDRNALNQLAEVAGSTGSSKEEARALVKLIEIEGLPTALNRVQRLVEINQCGEMGPGKRLALAKELRVNHPELADALLNSLGSRSGGPLQAEALFELADLHYTTDPQKAKIALERLHTDCETHPLHTQARARGWLP